MKIRTDDDEARVIAAHEHVLQYCREKASEKSSKKASEKAKK